MTALMRSRNVMHEFFGLLWYRINALRNGPPDLSLDNNNHVEPVPLEIQPQPAIESVSGN